MIWIIHVVLLEQIIWCVYPYRPSSCSHVNYIFSKHQIRVIYQTLFEFAERWTCSSGQITAHVNFLRKYISSLTPSTPCQRWKNEENANSSLKEDGRPARVGGVDNFIHELGLSRHFSVLWRRLSLGVRYFKLYTSCWSCNFGARENFRTDYVA